MSQSEIVVKDNRIEIYITQEDLENGNIPQLQGNKGSGTDGLYEVYNDFISVSTIALQNSADTIRSLSLNPNHAMGKFIGAGPFTAIGIAQGYLHELKQSRDDFGRSEFEKKQQL